MENKNTSRVVIGVLVVFGREVTLILNSVTFSFVENPGSYTP